MTRIVKVRKVVSATLIGLGFLYGCTQPSSRKSIEVPCSTDAMTIASVVEKQKVIYAVAMEDCKTITYLHKSRVGYQLELWLKVISDFEDDWRELYDLKLCGEYEVCTVLDSLISFVEIDDSLFLFIPMEHGHLGTAFIGHDGMRFAFLNVTNHSTSTIEFSKFENSIGNYSFENVSNRNRQKFLSLTSPIIRSFFEPYSVKNIDDRNQFAVKWLIENDDIYNRIERDTESWHDLKFTKYSAEFFEEWVDISHAEIIRIGLPT